MRLFIGFLIPEEYKQEIAQLQSEIGQLEIDCKNVEKENLHISMSFLGETAEDDAEKIKNDLAEMVSGFKKFTVDVGGMRAIPSKNFVRVIALEISENSGILTKLLDEIRTKIGGDVKPPHLTLSRLKSTRNKDKLISLVERYESKSFVSIRVSSIQLIESKLGRGGPEYSIINESTLHD